jgi:Leucine-rich repeat (LRR) protein
MIMKKYLFIFIILQVFTLSVFSQSLNEAKRLLKLANTYITSENFDNANDNLNKAKEIIAKYNSWEGKYWDAAADETLGNLYLKNGVTPLAQISYETALKKYKKLLHSKEGSQVAMEELLAKINGLEQSTFSIDSKNSKVISLDNTKKAVDRLELPPGVESFSCNNCKLKEFPYSALQSQKIKTIVLSNNRIKEFTPQKNNNLEYLDLSNNRLKEINGSLKDLSKLKYFDISGNSFKAIPTGLTELKGLKVLKLTGNKIPFSMIKNLIQSMPNTLVIHDNYILEEPIEEEETFPAE